jgi:putative ABC transport system substrate-binding protein
MAAPGTAHFKWSLAAIVAAGILLLGLAAYAQQNKLPRVGVLSNAPLTSAHYEAFRQALRDLGYVEGKNITFIPKSAQGNTDLFPELARELARANVDVMVVAGDQGLRAAKEATDTIPIVVLACDPLDRLVASIARPGGKATGLTCISSELAAKRLQLLRELLSTLTRVAILYNPEDRNKEWEYKQSQEAADKLKLTLRAYEARSPIEIDEAFTRIVNDHAQALIIFADVLTFAHQKRLADLALAYRLPAMFGFREFTEMGGLISYGSSNSEMWRRAAPYVDKILRGADPGEIPIDQPTRFELVVNAKTAKTLDIRVPASLLVRADDVIE